jgi:hypothetical protein
MGQIGKSLAQMIKRQCKGCEERRKKIAEALDRVWKRPTPPQRNRPPTRRPF